MSELKSARGFISGSAHYDVLDGRCLYEVMTEKEYTHSPVPVILITPAELERIAREGFVEGYATGQTDSYNHTSVSEFQFIHSDAKAEVDKLTGKGEA